MARIIHRLTAVAVTNAKAKGLHPDGAGLYLRITSTGTKSWILRFKRDGRTRDMGLGPLGLISLARARELAAEAGRQRLQGLDPIKARDAQRATAKREEASALTFKDCAEQLRQTTVRFSVSVRNQVRLPFFAGSLLVSPIAVASLRPAWLFSSKLTLAQLVPTGAFSP